MDYYPGTSSHRGNTAMFDKYELVSRVVLLSFFMQ